MNYSRFRKHEQLMNSIFQWKMIFILYFLKNILCFKQDFLLGLLYTMMDKMVAVMHQSYFKFTSIMCWCWMYDVGKKLILTSLILYRFRSVFGWSRRCGHNQATSKSPRQLGLIKALTKWFQSYLSHSHCNCCFTRSWSSR